MSAYEVVPYEDRPVAETHPDRVWVAARRAGVPMARPEGVRVLEIGCAHGINLIPMAFHLPGASFVGVDLSPRQIERGRALVAELGLKNLELRCADVIDDDPGEGAFDLVIAHGVFSWVPDAVRDRILAVCRRALAPGGVAYLSYNTMPAWGVRGAIRGALLELVAGAVDDLDAIRRAREAIGRLAALDPLAGTAEGALLGAELSELEGRSDAYLLHEYLAPHCRAYWVREFVALAQGAGLRWVGDLAPTGLDPARERDLRRGVGALVGDPIAREQLVDALGFRQFRASLLCRDDLALDPPTDAAWLAPLWLAASADEGEDDPITAWLRDRGPAGASAAEVIAATGVTTTALVDRVDAGRLAARARGLPMGARDALERPRASALTRFEARRFPFVTTPLHECASLDAFHAALVHHLDGSRTTGEVVDAIADDVLARRLRVAGGATPSRTQLMAALPSMVDAAIARLRDAGLLVSG